MTENQKISGSFGVRSTAMFTRVLALLLAAFFTGIAAVSLFVWVKNGHIASLLSVVTLLWLVWAAGCALFLYKWKGGKGAALIVFLIALLPRLGVALCYAYPPASDFTNYWAMGQAFLQGNTALISATVAQYRILEFSGLAALWGGMQWLSGGTMAGFQILQCVITAGIAAAACLLGSRINRRTGLLAGILFALYPSNLVMAQVFTNQHLAILCALFSIILFLRGMDTDPLWKRALYGAASGLLLLVSHYAHPSSVITRIAIILYALLLLLRLRGQYVRVLTVLAACLFLFSAVKTGADAALLAGGYRRAETQQYASQSRLLIGLLPENNGELDSELWDATFANASDEDILAAVYAQLQHPAAILKLIIQKAARMWGAMDSSFSWYTRGENEPGIASAIAKPLGALDVLFVAAVYLLAAVGFVFQRRDTQAFLLPAIVIAGWISVFLLMKIQMRYRYYAMPLLMLFAALGLTWLLSTRKKETA